MKKISELTAQLTPAEMLQWRAGYRHHLESKGIPPESAADLAGKVSYRADLYPTDLAATRPLFQLVPPTTPGEQATDAKANPLKDSRRRTSNQNGRRDCRRASG
jgi:hypothetical protein